MEGDLQHLLTCHRHHSFNPRPHMEGDSRVNQRNPLNLGFQSTPSHGGRHDAVFLAYQFVVVSIHALTWRATNFSWNFDWSRSMFQSTPSHGGRPRVATSSISSTSFNPRPHMEGDSDADWGTPRVSLFQSTPSHGGRRETPGTKSQPLCFNPRPHMEGDWPQAGRKFLYEVSIHALTWRATSQQRRLRQQRSFITAQIGVNTL